VRLSNKLNVKQTFDKLDAVWHCLDMSNQTGQRVVFVLECGQTGETQSIIVCQKCAQTMPPVGALVRVHAADDDCRCQLCKVTK